MRDKIDLEKCTFRISLVITGFVVGFVVGIFVFYAVPVMILKTPVSLLAAVVAASIFVFSGIQAKSFGEKE